MDKSLERKAVLNPTDLTLDHVKRTARKAIAKLFPDSRSRLSRIVEQYGCTTARAMFWLAVSELYRFSCESEIAEEEALARKAQSRRVADD